MKNLTLITALTALAYATDLALMLPSWQGGAGGGRAAYAQALNVSASIPAYINTEGLAPDEVRYMVHDMTVQVPLGSGTVQVRAGFSAGDTSLMVRDFALGTQTWPDSTWVRPSGNGHLIGLGRFIGLDVLHVQVYNGGSLIGTGIWERP